MVNVTCDQCGAVYSARPYLARKAGNHFCGSACYGVWQQTNRVGVGRTRVPVNCTTCGKTIEKQPNTIKKDNFCDRSCFAVWRASDRWCGANNPAWLGGHIAYRGPNWKRQAKAARERDGGKCVGCGYAPASKLPVHHVRPFRLFADYRDANQLGNLATLCTVCHGRAEVAFWKANPVVAKLYPLLVPAMLACGKCGADFIPRSWAAKACDACCSADCARCGNRFYSRRAISRPIKYCSRLCRHAAVRRHTKPLRTSS